MFLYSTSSPQKDLFSKRNPPPPEKEKGHQNESGTFQNTCIKHTRKQTCFPAGLSETLILHLGISTYSCNKGRYAQIGP